jgi:hypothetical protein
LAWARREAGTERVAAEYAALLREVVGAR